MPKTMDGTARRAALGLGVAFLCAGCVAEDATGPYRPGSNLPVVGVTAQSFGFAVLAAGFDFEQTYQSPTQGDSLAISLAITSYGGGSALIAVADADGVSRFAQTVTSNLAQGQVAPGGRPPYTVHLRFTGFTGVVALGVAAQSP